MSNSKDYQYGKQRHVWYYVAAVSLAAVVALGFLLKPTTNPSRNQQSELVVYCAAGIRKPVEEMARRYEDEFGVTIRLDYGSSGEMESKLALDRENSVSRCDLYIPADQSFAERAHTKGLTEESIPLARFRVVLAVKPDSSRAIEGIDDLLSQNIPFVICDELAGVGKKTKDVLSAAGKWDAVATAKKATFPRVPEAANAIKTSSDLEAGFLWNSTAKQFGLAMLNLPELAGAVATITGNVTATTESSRQALHFARYLAAPDRGQPSFEKYFFERVDGDFWADVPELRIYCGGVNRQAIEETIRDFELREGCRIESKYAGCGMLIGDMNTGQAGFPDVFLTCDASYMDMVQPQFGTAKDVSSTQVVMLVRKGNPQKIQSLKDLARDDLTIGTTNKRMSTLGDLSYQLFHNAGVLEAIEANKSVIVTAPTAHELILQFEGDSEKLDVVLVYQANCQHLKDRFDIIPIHDPRATAIQNIAIAKTSKFPNLTDRLLNAITSSVSRNRFEKNGFEWMAEAQANE